MVLPPAESRPTTRYRFLDHLPFLVALACVIVLTGLPLWHPRITSGHDALVYLPRQVEFGSDLAAGEVVPRWAADFSAGYGNPTFLFSPPAFYYVAAAWSAIGFDLIFSQNLACLTFLFLAGFAMFVLAGSVFGPWGGLVAATAYVLAPYVLQNLYVRHALADFSAFASLPLSFWGLWRFSTGPRRRMGLIGILSLALLILSSSSVSALAFPALLALLIWLAIADRSWRTLGYGALYLALGLGLAAYFWLPSLAESHLVHIQRRLDEGLDWHNHFVYAWQLISSAWGYGLSRVGSADGMSFALGPVHLVTSMATLVLVWRMRASSKRLWMGFGLVLVAGALFFTNALSMPLWERLAVLHPLQFPWRFLALAAFGTALLCASPFAVLRPRRKLWLAAAMVCALLLLGLPHARPEGYLASDASDFTADAIRRQNITTTVSGEFVPIGVSAEPGEPAVEPITFLEGEGDIEILQTEPAHRLFHATIVQPARLRLNTFYFPGWTIRVEGRVVPVDHDNPSGVMDFTVAPGAHTIEASFRDTPPRRIGMWISVVATLGLAATACVVVRGRGSDTQGGG